MFQAVVKLGGDTITTVSSSRRCELRECELVTELEEIVELTY